MTASNLSAEVCNKLTKQFAEITGTDEACGHFFLQDCDWNLESAVNRYMADTAAGGSSSASYTLKEKKVPLMLRVLSWNTDGLDKGNLATRTKAMASIILRDLPHIAFLQEVTPDSIEIIREAVSSRYQLVNGAEEETISANAPGYYFTLVLLRRTDVKLLNQTVIPFDNSVMGRSLQIVRCEYRSVELVVSTTHLESGKDYSKERSQQLKFIFDQISSFEKGSRVIFGGDLNIRDTELEEIGGLIPSLKDCWIEFGSKKETRFTWDCRKNCNSDLAHLKSRAPQHRFDRIYFSENMRVTNFNLVGVETIRTVLCHPSDHWGILATLEF